MQLILNGDTTHAIVFFMTSSTDHITGLTGATPTVTISKNTAAYAAPAGAVAEINNGFYKLTPATADINANGMWLLHATASGGDPCDVSAQVVAFSPYDAVALGLSDLPSILTQATTAATQATTAATQATTAATQATTAATQATTAATEATIAAGFGAAPTASAVATATATAILTTPGNKLTTDGTGAIAANNLVTGLLDLANGVESTVTVRQALRLCTAVLGGVLSGAGGTSVTIQAASNPGTTRVAATVDTAGDRTAVNLTL